MINVECASGLIHEKGSKVSTWNAGGRLCLLHQGRQEAVSHSSRSCRQADWRARRPGAFLPLGLGLKGWVTYTSWQPWDIVYFSHWPRVKKWVDGFCIPLSIDLIGKEATTKGSMGSNHQCATCLSPA